MIDGKGPYCISATREGCRNYIKEHEDSDYQLIIVCENNSWWHPEYIYMTKQKGEPLKEYGIY